jgi:hypothetical protein
MYYFGAQRVAVELLLVLCPSKMDEGRCPTLSCWVMRRARHIACKLCYILNMVLLIATNGNVIGQTHCRELPEGRKPVELWANCLVLHTASCSHT